MLRWHFDLVPHLCQYDAGTCQCQADTATWPSLARHGPARCRRGPDTVRHGSEWRGLTWQREVRGLARVWQLEGNGLANKKCRVGQ